MKLVLLLACFAVASTAQHQASASRRRKPNGPAELEASADGVVIHYLKRDWKVNLSTLSIRAEECEEPDAAEKNARRIQELGVCRA